jgi:PAS domain S-box-containing protein
MQSNNDRFTARSLTIAALFAGVIAASFFIAKSSSTPEIFQLHFNPYALLSATSVFLTLILFLRIATNRSHSEESTWFMLVMLGDILFSGGEMIQRLSATTVGAVFWGQVSGFGVILIPVGLFLFAVAYTRPAQTRPGAVIPVMIAVASLVSLFFAEGNLIFNNIPSAMHLYAWGFNNDPGPAFFLSVSWIFLPSMTAVFLFMRFWRINHDQLLRKQSLLYAVAILIPIIGGVITDAVLPSLQIDVIPPLATLLELATTITIFYGLSRYQFFQINPAILADNVLKTMNEAVVVTRPDFMVEFINKEAERLLGMTSEELSSGYIHRLFTPESWPKIHAYVAGETTDDAELGDLAIINSAGQRVPVRVFTSSMLEGESFQAIIFVISDVTDITESYNRLESDAARIRKLLEQSHHLQKQLEDEKAGVEHTVELRTRELSQAQVRLKAADELKTEFMLLSAHNLRTPITIMAGSVELLKGKGKESDRAFFLDALEQSINHLRDFVEDMVTITTLEAGSGLITGPVTVGDLLKPILMEAEAMGTTKDGITFTSDLKNVTAIVDANTARLQGAVRNLINNAFKFTKAGTIELSSKKVGANLVIAVTDTGIGIAEDEIGRLFTKFHRGTDTIRFEYEGEGIGLYLTKLIVTEHHGTIAVESEIGEGSTFTISIPLLDPKG